MEENQLQQSSWSTAASAGSSSESKTVSEMDLLKKKMMERMSFDIPDTFPTTLLNGSGATTSSSSLLAKKQEGFTMTREIKAVQAQQVQFLLSSNRDYHLPNSKVRPHRHHRTKHRKLTIPTSFPNQIST
jgi:hypothetical protein